MAAQTAELASLLSPARWPPRRQVANACQGFMFAHERPRNRPVTIKARPFFGSGQAPVLRLRFMENPMKLQIAVQVGKSFKLTASVAIPATVVLAVLALLV